MEDQAVEQNMTQAPPPVVPVASTAVPVAPTNIVPLPTQPVEKLTAKEKRKKLQEEAENIVAQYLTDGVFTFPTTGLQVRILFIPEAAYQRFFFQGDLPPLPEILYKTAKGKRGKEIRVPDYDNEGYKDSVKAYNNHNGNVRQQQAGKMMRYIYGKGTIVTLPQEWIDEFELDLDEDEVVSTNEMKYAYLAEQSRTDAELKALTIAVCGKDPLGGSEEDEEDEDE